MNFTSQICTTKEQSERLLAMGLKKETADMHYYHTVDFEDNEVWSPSVIPYTDILFNAEFVGELNMIENDIIPAWSLHRLMEIADTNSIDSNSAIGFYDGFYDEIIAQIKSCIHLGLINKEYLNMDIVNANEDKNIELLKNGGKQHGI